MPMRRLLAINMPNFS